jgi:glycosyltransferase involved in cell wall biosynthesis
LIYERLAQLRRMHDRALERFLDYAKFDSAILKGLIGCVGLLLATLLRAISRESRAVELETSLHRNAFFPPVDRVVESRIRDSIAAPSGKLAGYLEDLLPQAATEVFFRDPARLVGHRILAVKSPDSGEKGVLIVDYSFVFSLLARFFDVEQIASRYYIVLETSWSGLCDRDVLVFAGYDFPVFVQSHEPRDSEFLHRFRSNLILVPIAANWWVDHRVFRPLPSASRDADVLMNSAWARFKRHESVFSAVAGLRKKGHRLALILVGYSMDMTRDDVFDLAKKHGIANQVEMFERLQPEQVNELLNRVHVNLVWSRREGSNRAIIEGFAAGVPGILRAGFNYGHEYPFMNSATGSYASDRNLASTLTKVISNYDEYDPRAWVVQNMSPQVATRMLDEAIAGYAARAGEKWTRNQMAVKVTSLDSMAYWDEGLRARFEPDHRFVLSTLYPRA